MFSLTNWLKNHYNCLFSHLGFSIPANFLYTLAMPAKRSPKPKKAAQTKPRKPLQTPKTAFAGFDPVDPKQSFPALEAGILRYWREEDTFKRSIEQRENGEIFSFYDGPPFATGLPHYGHILAGTIKDVIPRYQTMRGKNVQRRFGWDCHGLPVENEIEKEHGLKGKKDIEAMGVRQFNDLCRSAVQRYTGEWRTAVERMGRWVDMDWDYRTMDPDYMESIWWVFRQLYDKGLIYEGHKTMHICPRCATPLANFEVTQGYRDRSDWSVIVTFPLKDDKNTRILAWTTTPWSLPGNFFLAMGADHPYVRVRMDEKDYIVAKPLVEKVFGRMRYEVVQDVSAHEFVGKKYVPLFPYFTDLKVPGNAEGKTYGDLAYEVLLADTVDVNEGTGIVHLASGYGEDGFELSKQRGIGVRHHVTMDGKLTDEVKDFAGMEVKPEKDPQSTDRAIARYLDGKKRLFSEGAITHSYPHCWRCDTPLLNYAASSWFVAVEKLKERMIAVNGKTEWVPAHIRDGRFGKWLSGARDWAISRSRYWGTPLPIWKNEKTGEIEVIGSRDELMDRAPGRFTKVTVARHAQSEGNVLSVYQGAAPGTPLTSTGKRQAAELAQKIAADGRPVNAIYHSPLDRTMQTAQAVHETTSAALICDDRLREVTFGEYEGKHVDFSDLTFAKGRRAHKLDQNQVESIYHFPGMETWMQVEERCKDFLDAILPKHRGEHIVIVTHADVLMNFTHLFSGQDKHKIVHQPYPPLAGSRTFYYDHETGKQMDLHKETVDDILFRSAKSDPKSAVTLTVVRHGETEWNAQGKFQGSSDIPLNEDGRRQAQEIANQLNADDYDVILSSSLVRAKETADIIAKVLDKDVITSELLAEQNLGDFEGRTKTELIKLFPQFVSDRLFHYKHITNGESEQKFRARVKAAKETLLKDYAGKHILLVSHRRWISMLLNIEHGSPIWKPIENTSIEQVVLAPHLERIPDVLDCWFESGAMPYAQEHYPFEQTHSSKPKAQSSELPSGFPADFIAEGLDQTRGWFYTLTVLSTALFDQSAFRHCVVNGIVLAEDGKKMSKRLKNYPEPLAIAEKYGADSVRFALMSSPAVRGEDLRFSEKLVEETLRNVILPLWNAYNLFVTYAAGAGWKPESNFSLTEAKPADPLDQWIVAVTQDLVNRMTKEFDGYDLSATCAQLSASIDGLTNWYIRLSRRRFALAGPGQAQAFDTLYRVLLANCQLLAPFCPFLTEAIFLNLRTEAHGSIHLTDWPQSRVLTQEERHLIAMMGNTQTVVTLGLSLRSDAKIKVRQPLASVTFGLPPSDRDGVRSDIIQSELNVKQIKQVQDPGLLAKSYVQVDARKVGPRLGAKVQDIIREGKAGNFSCDGNDIVILDEHLSADEARVMYVGNEGQNAACDRGIVVTVDTVITDELKQEGIARDLIRAIQTLRKDAGYSFTDVILLSITGMPTLLDTFGTIISRDTRATLGENDGVAHTVTIGAETFTVRMKKMASSPAVDSDVLDTFDLDVPEKESSLAADTSPTP